MLGNMLDADHAHGAKQRVSLWVYYHPVSLCAQRSAFASSLRHCNLSLNYRAFIPMADWTANSNEALTLSLGEYVKAFCPVVRTGRIHDLCYVTVRSKPDKESLATEESYENFHPTFTYPVSAFSSLALVLLMIWGSRFTETTRKYMDTRT